MRNKYPPQIYQFLLLLIFRLKNKNVHPRVSAMQRAIINATLRRDSPNFQDDKPPRLLARVHRRLHARTPGDARANRVSVIFNSFLVNGMVRSAAILRSYTRIQRTVTEIELSPRRLSLRWGQLNGWTLGKPNASTEFHACHSLRKYDEKMLNTVNKM